MRNASIPGCTRTEERRNARAHGEQRGEPHRRQQHTSHRDTRWRFTLMQLEYRRAACGERDHDCIRQAEADAVRPSLVQTVLQRRRDSRHCCRGRLDPDVRNGRNRFSTCIAQGALDGRHVRTPRTVHARIPQCDIATPVSSPATVRPTRTGYPSPQPLVVSQDRDPTSRCVRRSQTMLTVLQFGCWSH